MENKMWIHPCKDSPTYFCPTVKVLWQHFFFLQFHVWSWTLRTPESTRLLINAQWNWLEIRARALNNLDVLERVDLRLRRAEDILRPRSCDLHQVQKPFPIFVPFGPLNVQWGFDRGLPQVVYLKEKSISLFHDLNPYDGSELGSDEWTYSERIFDQTSDLFFCLHGAFTLHNTSKWNLVRPGFPVQNKQIYWFRSLKKGHCILYCSQTTQTYPLTDNGNSIMTFTFTLIGTMFSCTLVLKEKRISGLALVIYLHIPSHVQNINQLRLLQQ